MQGQNSFKNLELCFAPLKCGRSYLHITNRVPFLLTVLSADIFRTQHAGQLCRSARTPPTYITWILIARERLDEKNSREDKFLVNNSLLGKAHNNTLQEWGVFYVVRAEAK
jgi:hypothetical protein